MWPPGGPDALFALTTDPGVYHALNLRWRITPLLVERIPQSFERLVNQAETTLRAHNVVTARDEIRVVGGVPRGKHLESNFVKLHGLSDSLSDENHRLCAPIVSPGDKVRCALHLAPGKVGLLGIRGGEVLMRWAGRAFLLRGR